MTDISSAIRGLQFMLDQYSGKRPYEGYPKALQDGIAIINTLSAALTQSREEMAKLLAMNDAGYDTVTKRAVAAAYERAAVTLDKEAASLRADASRFRGGTDPHHYRMNFASAAIKQASAIRALATPDQTAALEAIRAEARARGMREAAVICRNVGFKDHPDSVAYDAEFQVLAAITKGDKA